jgi:hypothetical protein
MNKNLITYSVAAIVLAIVFILCFMMADRVERKFAFIVEGVEIAQSQSITVGKNSGICFHQIPHDYMEITRSGDSFRWRVNDAYQDSLQYYKINNVNPNKHAIRNDNRQKISLIFPPYSFNTQDTLHLSLTGAEVWSLWEKFKEQKDILFRWFAIKKQLEENGCSHLDSLKWLAHLQNGSVRSFFHKSDDRIDIIILDRYTAIDDTILYVRDGSTTAMGDTARHCKLQFFGIGDYCYRNDKPEDGYFHINGVNYVMKPYVKSTEWGAGHVMVSNTESGLLIHYPKPVTFVATIDSLEKLSKQSSGIITIKQSNNAIPAEGDVYLPEFSNAINFDLCNLEFKEGIVRLRDNNYQESSIENHVSLVPALQRITLQSGDDNLIGRTGFIDRSFILSYLCLPLIVWFVLLLLIWLPGSPFKKKYADLDLLYNKAHLQHYPIYLSTLLTICLAYCCCKSLIALKLSYTYPYFEKLTGIMPVSTGMMMLLFFTISMVLNAPLLHFNASWKSLRLWSGWGVCLVLFGFLVFCFFGIMDTQVNNGMLQSYLLPETSFLHFKEWFTPGAIQDTHRSVVYSLFAIEAAVLTICLILNFFWSSIKPFFDWMQSDRTKWKTLFIQILFLGTIFAVGLVPGNFSTAFITFLVILGLCDVMSFMAGQFMKGGNLHIGILLMGMFAVTVIYILVAFWSDHGYMTNYFGFFLFFFFIFFLVERPDTTRDAKAFRSLKAEKRWIKGLFAFFAVVAVTMTLICHYFIDSEKVNYARYARRMMLYTNFDDLQKSGYRYHESDAEFMVIMSHYMQNNRDSDPLSNDAHPLHPSVSTGQSPVILNDLSVPVAFIGTYGYAATMVFFLLLALLAWLVMRYSICYSDDKPVMTTAMQWRIMAMLMWVSTSLYIYLSYHSWFPFTGRLNPGFGVDAVGEAFETAILLAFMASVTCKNRKNIK